MKQDWQIVTQMTMGKELLVKKVQLLESGVQIEGDFELPPLATLVMEDQVFVAAFLKSHGSIKEMERLFGVSYPTVKARLSKIGEKLTFIDVDEVLLERSVIDKLTDGEISVEAALDELDANK
jgi:hypothetical protein